MRSRTDLVVSINALGLTFAGGAAAAFLGLMMVAFTDSCPPATCDLDRGITAIMTGFGAAAAIGVVGVVVTIIRLVRRSTGWPFALTTLLLCGSAVAAGMFGYWAAVGG